VSCCQKGRRAKLCPYRDVEGLGAFPYSLQFSGDRDAYQESRILIYQHVGRLFGYRLSCLALASSALVLGLAIAAPSLSAQSSAAADSVAHRLAPVNINAGAEKDRGIFHRMSDRAKVTYLERENRFLERKLSHLDGVMLRLEERLDSLKSARALRKHGIATLDSTAAAMRAHRIQLEAAVRLRELVAARRGPAEY